MADKSKTALAVIDGFNIVGRYEGLDEETIAELQAEEDDLDEQRGISCRKIKIPSGGGLAYEVQGEDDTDAEYMKEVNAVIIYTHRVCGYWPGSYGDEDNSKSPVCSSMDGKTGVNIITGVVTQCADCPLNQFGSAVNQQGGYGRGKACKNMRRLYLMLDGDPNLYLLTVPPTSIGDVNKQLTRIRTGGVPYTDLVVTLTLERAQNAAGTPYSKVALRKSGLLPPDVRAKARELRRLIDTQFKAMAIAPISAAPVQETQTDGAANGAGFAEIRSGDDEDLPF